MAISDSQKVDLLWKKVGFGKAKTDLQLNHHLIAVLVLCIQMQQVVL